MPGDKPDAAAAHAAAQHQHAQAQAQAQAHAHAHAQQQTQAQAQAQAKLASSRRSAGPPPLPRLAPAASSPLPPSRMFHTALSHKDHLVVFGGHDGSKPLSDNWCFSFSSQKWTQVPCNVAGRYLHSTVLIGDKVFLFGGSDSKTCLDDLYCLDLTTFTWTQLTPVSVAKPKARKGHASTVHRGRLFVFGGLSSDNHALNDVWFFDPNKCAWAQIPPVGETPSPRFQGLLASSESHDSLFVYGGIDQKNRPLNDFHQFHIPTRTWSPANIHPIPPVSRHFVGLHGGAGFYLLLRSRGTKQLELYEFDYQQFRWLRVFTSGDNGRSFEGSSIVLRDRTIFKFGGHDEQTQKPASFIEHLEIKNRDDSEETLTEDGRKLHELPKSEWEAMAMRRKPDVLELRERGRPLGNNYQSYARRAHQRRTTTTEIENGEAKQTTLTEYLMPERTDCKNALSVKLTLQLIMEHLNFLDYRRTVAKLQDESDIKYVPDAYAESRLMTLLRIAKKRVKGKQDLFDPELLQAIETDEDVVVLDHLARGEDDDGDKDLNIWDEPSDSEKNIIRVVDASGGRESVKAATLNKLVERLTALHNPELLFMKIFLTTYQSFTSPERLLRKLVQRYSVPSAFADRVSAEERDLVCRRVVDVIRFWIEKFPQDFNDRMTTALTKFIEGPLTTDGRLSYCKLLRGSLSKHVESRKKLGQDAEIKRIMDMNPPEPKVPQNIFSRSLKLTDIPEEEVARQLTLIEFNIFSDIQISEFLNKAFQDRQNIRARAPHINAIFIRYGRIAKWVSTYIITPEKSKHKARYVDYFLKVCDHLRNFNNMQTLYSIMHGMWREASARGVDRNQFAEILKSLEGRSRELFQEFHTILEDSSFRHHQMLIAKQTLPFIPLLGRILEQILMIEKEQPDHVQGNLINFSKRQAMYDLLMHTQHWQNRPFNLQPVYQIITFLNKFPVDATTNG